MPSSRPAPLWRSASTRITRRPRFARSSASMTAEEVFPAPPLWLTIESVFITAPVCRTRLLLGDRAAAGRRPILDQPGRFPQAQGQLQQVASREDLRVPPGLSGVARGRGVRVPDRLA